MGKDKSNHKCSSHEYLLDEFKIPIFILMLAHTSNLSTWNIQ